jgi:hypothetical protein
MAALWQGPGVPTLHGRAGASEEIAGDVGLDATAGGDQQQRLRPEAFDELAVAGAPRRDAQGDLRPQRHTEEPAAPRIDVAPRGQPVEGGVEVVSRWGEIGKIEDIGWPAARWAARPTPEPSARATGRADPRPDTCTAQAWGGRPSDALARLPQSPSLVVVGG